MMCSAPNDDVFDTRLLDEIVDEVGLESDPALMDVIAGEDSVTADGADQDSGQATDRRAATGQYEESPDKEPAYVTTDELNCHDILCGKGTGAITSAGNKHLREVVASRMNEHLKCTKNKEKSAIARDVCDKIRHRSVPGGRFLKRATEKQAVEWGFESNKSVWVFVDEAAMMERVKMAFRDYKRPRCKATRSKNTPVTPVQSEQDGEHQQHPSPQPDSNGSNDLRPTNGQQTPELHPSAAAPTPFQGQHDKHTATEPAPQALLGDQGVAALELQLRGKLLALLKAGRGILKATCAAKGGQEPQALRKLGAKLYQLAMGETAPIAPESVPGEDECEFTGESRGSSKRERSQTAPNAIDALTTAGYSVPFATLVSNLIDATDAFESDRFTSVQAADEEMALMLAQPDRYLLGPPTSELTGKICFTEDKLYGRSKEMERLVSAYEEIMEGTGSNGGLVLISGLSGTGKTSLVECLRPTLARRRGALIPIKFEPNEQSMPIVFRSLDQYCSRVLHDNAEFSADFGLAVKMALGPAAAVFQHLLPNLGVLIGGWAESAVVVTSKGFGNGQEMYNLVLHSLRIFVRAIAAPSRPVIIHFDDCQWADTETLNWLQTLAMDPETSSLLIIGSYRSNEVDKNHALMKVAGNVALAGKLIAMIPLANLDKDSVNEEVSDVFHLTPRLTRPLSKVLYTKTQGNPMFIKELISSLFAEGLIYLSASQRRWKWNIAAIQEKNIADNAVDFFVAEMKNYPSKDVQWIMRVASSLGSEFNVSDLARLCKCSGISGTPSFQSDMPESDVVKALDRLVDDGLVVRKSDSTYRFGHDQIRAASYALTPPSEQPGLHLWMGRQLLRDSAARDANLFTITDQLNRAVGLISDHDERIRLAELNLQAGEKSRSSLSLLQSCIYHLQGAILLREDDWRDNYQLCLRLFTACAEAQITQGNNKEAILSTDPVLKYGKNQQDMLPAYYSLTLANFAQAKMKDAIDSGLTALNGLGENLLVPNPDQNILLNELGRTQRLIEKESLDTFQEKNIAINANVAERGRFLMLLSRIAFATDQALCQLCVFRLVQIGLEEGLSPESSYGFSLLALILHKQHYSLAVKSSNIALKLIERFQGKYDYICLYLLNSSTIAYSQPLQACIQTVRQLPPKALSLGDVTWAMTSMGYKLFLSMFAPERGATLRDAENETREDIDKMLQYRHNHMSFINVNFQAMLNLRTPLSECSSDNIDPTVLTGEVLKQDEVLATCIERKMMAYVRRIYLLRFWLAYLFRRYDVAVEMLEKFQDAAKSMRIFVAGELFIQTFYSGLLAVAILRQQKGTHSTTADVAKWRSLAISASKELKEWSTVGCKWNFQHRYDLMMAEIASLEGNFGDAKTAYDEAIAGAERHAFINDQALASERAGLFYLQQQGDSKMAKCYFMMAKDLYHQWGALRKVDELQLMTLRI